MSDLPLSIMQKTDPKQITSTANPKVKSLIKLRQRPYRKNTGLTLVEGTRELRLALKGKPRDLHLKDKVSNGVYLREIYYCQEYLKDCETKVLLKQLVVLGLDLYKVSRPVFAKIAFGDRREGIVAVAEVIQTHLGQLNTSKQSLFVIVESVEKPGNLGAIMRTCDAVGIDALIVCEAKTDIYNPNVIRASIGTCFSQWVVEANRVDVIRWLKQKHIRIIAATPLAQKSYWQADYRCPCAIVLGCEDKGISDCFKKASDLDISIPMQGEIDSLNVSTSAAILLYEVLRQRGLK